MLWATFELEAGSAAAQTKMLSGLAKMPALPADPDSPIVFPSAEDPEAFTSIRSLLESVEIGLNSPLPTTHMRFALSFYPELSSARKILPTGESTNQESFLLFTSGSTGTPKGIRISQAGIMNYAAAKSSALKLGPVKVLQQSSPGFDMSLAQAFNALANGGTLLVASSRVRGTFNVLSLENASRGTLSLTGTVGFPIPNTSAYIVDSRTSEPLPVGFPGEICIGGAGVALGYLDPQMNEAKFVPNPFATAEDLGRGWKKMYRTGDRGCLRPDGSLVFLGRMDGDLMVKLRGLRIELDEVSHAIMVASQGSLADAAVSVRGDPEFLVANAVPSPNHDLNGQDLKKILPRLTLPRYMAPSIILLADLSIQIFPERYLQQILRLSGLPTTPNGKLDRKALGTLPLPAPEPIEREGMEADHPPLTVAEGELSRLWCLIIGQAVGDAPILPETDFFAVGGSSLQLVRLQNALRERMGIGASLQDLYQRSTLGQMETLMSHEWSRLVASAIDWSAETDIPPHVQSVIDDVLIKINVGVCVADAQFDRPPSVHPDFGRLGHSTSSSTAFHLVRAGDTPVRGLRSRRQINDGVSPPTDGYEGLTASKWASEVFLEKVSRVSGLPVVIHRTCSVVGHAPSDDAMNSVLRFSRLSRTVPAVPNAEGFFDFHEIAEVAGAIVRAQIGNDNLCFQHHSSGVRISFADLASRMASLYGGQFDEVNLVDWIQRARKLGMEEHIVSYVVANVLHGGSLKFPYLGEIRTA
ncbi:hypothetical protein BJX63DRAFT_427023 [Aspergillus granulosus]|uniref:Carrier domain-containing protein n=1 Tax=Aspergillus granulosus TaxID=176169 RepID=A0ABR4I3X6_9EURO